MLLTHRLALSLSLAIALFALTTAPAQAYVGPGLGLGAISTALGVVGAVLLGIVAFVWYPFKRLFRMLRQRTRKAAALKPVRPAGDARL